MFRNRANAFVHKKNLVFILKLTDVSANIRAEYSCFNWYLQHRFWVGRMLHTRFLFAPQNDYLRPFPGSQIAAFFLLCSWVIVLIDCHCLPKWWNQQEFYSCFLCPGYNLGVKCFQSNRSKIPGVFQFFFALLLKIIFFVDEFRTQRSKLVIPAHAAFVLFCSNYYLWSDCVCLKSLSN